MICARCGVKLVYGRHIRSRYTGNDYCRDYGDCVRRVLEVESKAKRELFRKTYLDADGDGKLVKAEVSPPDLTDGTEGSLT